jgi:HSP20 family molecular chaperone IbpA
VNGDHEHPLSSSSTHGLHGLDSLAHFLHVFNSHYNNEDGVTQHGVVHPHFDLAENNTLYVIYGELAGLSKKDVHVEVNDALFIITISGKIVRLAAPGSLGLPINDSTPETVGVVHREGDDVGTQTGEAAVEGGEAGKRQEDDLHWHVTERRVGSFRRAFQFSAESVDVAGVSATMTNGLLCVLVPKRERKAGEGEGRKVEIS